MPPITNCAISMQFCHLYKSVVRFASGSDLSRSSQKQFEHLLQIDNCKNCNFWEYSFFCVVKMLKIDYSQINAVEIFTVK